MTELNLFEVKEFKNLLNGEKEDLLKVKYFNGLKIVNYDKSKLTDQIVPMIGMFRSVVLNENNRIVALSPPKSVKVESFFAKYPLKSEDIEVQEFVEGTMINLFWNEVGWEIATKGNIGANNQFYKGVGLTFRDMFFDAVKHTNLNFDELNKNYSYSFVLQHPKNRIVVPFDRPGLVLVAVYDLTDQNKIKLVQYRDAVKDSSMSLIKFPKRNRNWESYDQEIKRFANPNMKTDFKTMGVIFTNVKTGERCKVRNPMYEYVRHLRGNQPKLQYQYLILRKEKHVMEYLSFYPEHNELFMHFKQSVHDYAEELFANYLSCYVQKSRPLKEFGQQFRTNMYHIHNKYVTELKEQGKRVNFNFVNDFVNNMEPSLLMHSMNFKDHKDEQEVVCEDI
jgi:hypothetical protein